MPRKQVVNVSDTLVHFAMTAPIDQVTSLLKVATQIVTVRASNPVNQPLPGPSKIRGARSAPLAVVPTVQGQPKPPVRPPTQADKIDLAAARDRANAAAGVGPATTRRPRAARPPVDQSAAAPAAPATTDVDPE